MKNHDISNPSPSEMFNKERAVQYDEKNSRLKPISDNLHFLMSIILKDLPQQSRILSVGAGTGAEIMTLARLFPQWSFVAVEPSTPMLEVCREKFKEAGILDRCELIQGYVHDVAQSDFDAVISLLVGHFVQPEERAAFYNGMTKRLRTGGILVNAEISFDLASATFDTMLKNWEEVQRLMGATPESLTMLPKALKEMLTVQPPIEVEKLIQQSGIKSPVQFFQAFMICGWYGMKTI